MISWHVICDVENRHMMARFSMTKNKMIKVAATSHLSSIRLRSASSWQNVTPYLHRMCSHQTQVTIFSHHFLHIWYAICVTLNVFLESAFIMPISKAHRYFLIWSSCPTSYLSLSSCRPRSRTFYSHPRFFKYIYILECVFCQNLSSPDMSLKFVHSV